MGVDEITLDGGDQARDGKYKVTRYVKSWVSKLQDENAIGQVRVNSNTVTANT